MRLLKSVIIILLLLPFSLAHSDSGVILLYHHVASDTPPSTSISPAVFRAHLEYLRDNDFQVIGLNEMLDAVRSKGAIPDKAIAITFDDGYSSIFDTAFPMLTEFGYPFTLFVSTGPIDRQQTNYMKWEEIKEMADAGVTIANHLVEHPYMLDKLPNEAHPAWISRMRQEITEAENTISQHTGQNHRLLAYPYGEYDIDIKNLVEEMGFIGLAQNSGAVGYSTDLGAVPRFPLASIYANLETAKVKFATKAFNVEQREPASPVSSALRPSATLKFLPGDYNFSQIGCFSDSEPMNLSWSDSDEGVLTIEPKSNLAGRRSRYICTAPDTNSDRYFWYSVQWINLKG